MAAQITDFLVIGGRIIGVSVAGEPRRVHPKASVVFLEKELRLGLYASGRNSIVLHEGFYYTADSLKAPFTRNSNQTLREYCKAKEPPLNEC
jgi:L-2-hydroxyglutarate oxidase LhgO